MATAGERRRWAVPPMTGTVDDPDLSMLDPADPDERRLLIEADHPMLQQALRDGLDEITLDGQVTDLGGAARDSTHEQSRAPGATAHSPTTLTMRPADPPIDRSNFRILSR